MAKVKEEVTTEGCVEGGRSRTEDSSDKKNPETPSSALKLLPWKHIRPENLDQEKRECLGG